MIEDFRDFNRAMLQQANKAATSNWNNLHPVHSELIAGAYVKGHIVFNGLSIEIENPSGSIRSGEDWSISMFNHYGYIPTVMGADGDELDVYVGEYQFRDTVTVIDQYLDGKYDETKCMLGFPDQDTAMGNYFMNFDANWPREGHVVHTVIWSEFIDWIHNGDTTKPFEEWVKR